MVRKKKAVLRRVRRQEIRTVVLIGKVELSASATFAALREGIGVSWISRTGRFLGSLAGPEMTTADRWLRQFELLTDAGRRLEIARSVVTGKIANQRAVLLRAQRRVRSGEIATALARMRLASDQTHASSNLDSLRGCEGNASAAYFGVFGLTIANPGFTFDGRNRRPPRDPVNACLSFGYAFLLSAVEAELRRCGLLPSIGVLHEPSRGRPSLALDLMEEFRPVAVDALILRLVNRRQLTRGDFDEWVPGEDPDADDHLLDLPPSEEPDGDERKQDTEARRKAVYLGKTGRQIFIQAWTRRLRQPITARNLEGRVSLRRAIELQAQHLTRVIEGRDQEYTPLHSS